MRALLEDTLARIFPVRVPAGTISLDESLSYLRRLERADFAPATGRAKLVFSSPIQSLGRTI